MQGSDMLTEMEALPHGNEIPAKKARGCEDGVALRTYGMIVQCG